MSCVLDAETLTGKSVSAALGLRPRRILVEWVVTHVASSMNGAHLGQEGGEQGSPMSGCSISSWLALGAGGHSLT